MSEKTVSTPFEESRAEDAVTPPYIPWKTLHGFLARWKSTTPHKIDPSTMPASMDGTTRRQLRSALKFLELTDADGVVTDKFKEVVSALGTPNWKDAVRTCILPAYSEITSKCPIENGTASQLDSCFRTKCKLDGQMLRKAVRFYLKALEEANVKFSPLFLQRREGASKPKRKNGENGANDKLATEKPGGQLSENPKPSGSLSQPPLGLIDYPLRFKGKVAGAIWVPVDLSIEDVKVIELMIPILRAYAGSTASPSEQGGG